MAIPPDVATYGRRVARRLGIDPDDGESYAGEAWADHPDAPGLWHTICWRDCVDTARHARPTVPLDEVARTAGAEEPGYVDAESRADLAALLAGLSDADLGALARVYWLGLPWGSANKVNAMRALRRARAGHRDTGCPLTPAELRVVEMVAAGATNRQMADALGSTVDTVKSHLWHVGRKVGTSARAAIVATALRRGWIA